MMILKGRKRRNFSYLLPIFLSVIGYTMAIYASTQDVYREAVYNSPNLKLVDSFTLVGTKSFFSGYDPVDDEGYVHAVIEIPTGSSSKWEVRKSSGYLEWELKKGRPRIVKYLGYPGNYGMIPKTIFPKDLGGDDDPLDIIVLGPAIARGSVVKARLIGVLKMLDNGEKDDKLIAVHFNSPFYEVHSMDELSEKFNAVSDIIKLWFANYKGPGKIVIQGYGNENEARKILASAVKAYSDN